MSTTHGRATSPSDAFWTLDPWALVKPADPWFVDIESLVPRAHYGVAEKLRRNLGRSQHRPDFVHVGLIGHLGTGKTTLVRNALATLSGDGLQPIYVNSLQSFDQGDFTFTDIVLVLAEQVIQHLAEQNLAVGREELESVRLWFAEELVTDTHRTQIQKSIQSTASATVSVPYLAAFSGKVAAALKGDSEYRREIRRRAERDPGELIRRVNLLLDAVHAALAPRKTKLCIVFDNLEKTKPEIVDTALLQRAEEYRQLRVNSVLLFHPQSEYSPVTTQASRAFQCINVPVLPVRFPEDGPDVVRDEAKRAIESVLDARLVLSRVFTAPEECVHALAYWSGGHMRHLLQIARRAVENVEPNLVSPGDIDDAARWLGGQLASSLRPEDLPRVAELHETHAILDTEQDRRMLHNACVLAYDGIDWWDVHPTVRGTPLFKQAWSARKSTSRDGEGS